jgi:hypothetical protein
MEAAFKLFYHLQTLYSPRPVQPYHFQPNPIWCDVFKVFINFVQNLSSRSQTNVNADPAYLLADVIKNNIYIYLLLKQSSK